VVVARDFVLRGRKAVFSTSELFSRDAGDASSKGVDLKPVFGLNSALAVGGLTNG